MAEPRTSAATRKPTTTSSGCQASHVRVGFTTTYDIASTAYESGSTFENHCSACHISQKLGGLSLASYPGLQAGGFVVPGPVFKVGDHKNSTMWKIIQPGTGQPGGARMPLGGPYLSSTEIDTIAKWIDQGAKNN